MASDPHYSGADAKVTVAVDADVSGMIQSFEQAQKGSLKLGSTLAGALDGVVNKGKNVASIFDALALSISKMALNTAFKPLDSAISSGISNIFGGPITPFANGGVFSGGLPIPFASGGVVSRPVTFPLGAGRTGIAGERGPEAILPLTRGADGKLGLATSGSASPITITFNVTSPDAASFSRSESQLAAMLARAVSQGQRNL